METLPEPGKIGPAVTVVETFALKNGAVSSVGTAPNLAAASARLPPGAYTTVRTYGGNGIPFLEEHFRRLEESARLQGRPGELDRPRLRAALSQALAKGGHPESRLRITFHPPEVFVSVEPFVPLADRLYAEGVWCVTVPLRRELPQAKDTRFLASAQAAYRELPAGAHEGLIVAEDGAILEGLSSNVFAVVDGVLRTEEARVLRGTTRGLVLELARGLVPVSLEAVDGDDLPRASEMFLTSVSREVLPVVKVDEVAIGRGHPGPLAGELRRRYRTRMETAAEQLLRV